MVHSLRNKPDAAWTDEEFGLVGSNQVRIDSSKEVERKPNYFLLARTPKVSIVYALNTGRVSQLYLLLSGCHEGRCFGPEIR